MKKKYLPVLTMSLLIAGMLSSCGNNSNGNWQEESESKKESTAEPNTVEPTAEPEAEITQPKFDIAKDVLLSYEYDSNGELSKVIFELDIFHWQSAYKIYEFKEFETTYDMSGHLESIETKFHNQMTGEISIKSDYNADGQIIFLTLTELGGYYGESNSREKYIYNYEVVYNSSKDCINVYISNQKDSDASFLNETRTYDSDCNLLSVEYFSDTGAYRTYHEYVNGLHSHSYRYNDSTGRLVSESIYHDNGNISERYIYDEETGEITEHYRYDRNGDRLK